jgi:hypothetical protein
VCCATHAVNYTTIIHRGIFCFKSHFQQYRISIFFFLQCRLKIGQACSAAFCLQRVCGQQWTFFGMRQKSVKVPTVFREDEKRLEKIVSYCEQDVSSSLWCANKTQEWLQTPFLFSTNKSSIDMIACRMCISLIQTDDFQP